MSSRWRKEKNWNAFIVREQKNTFQESLKCQYFFNLLQIQGKKKKLTTKRNKKKKEGCKNTTKREIKRNALNFHINNNTRKKL
jgi:hypothetical protein